jgi:hypothetical protein
LTKTKRKKKLRSSTLFSKDIKPYYQGYWQEQNAFSKLLGLREYQFNYLGAFILYSRSFNFNWIPLTAGEATEKCCFAILGLLRTMPCEGFKQLSVNKA